MFTTLRKTLVTVLAAVTIVAAPLAMVGVASAASDIQTNLGCGSNLSPDATGGCDTTSGSSHVSGTIKNLVNIFSAVVGIISVLMIIFGGLKYITSGGDSNNVSSAKNTIIYAILGLVVVALAQFIVQLVLNKVTTASGS